MESDRTNDCYAVKGRAIHPSSLETARNHTPRSHVMESRRRCIRDLSAAITIIFVPPRYARSPIGIAPPDNMLARYKFRVIPRSTTKRQFASESACPVIEPWSDNNIATMMPIVRITVTRSIKGLT